MNFRGGEAELRESFESMADELKHQLAPSQVHFQFNPPNAPHFGGTREREVRSIKTALYTILGAQTVSSVIFIRQDENLNDDVRPLFSMMKMRLRRTSPKPCTD